MFGVVEASAWMHVRNGTFKMCLLFGLESDSVCLFLWLLSFGHAKESNTPKGRKPKPIISNRLDERRREKTDKSKAMHPHGGPWERDKNKQAKASPPKTLNTEAKY